MLTELVTIAAAAKAVTLDLKEVLALKKHNSLIELEIKQFITSLNDNIDQLKKQPPKKGGSWAPATEKELNEASSELKSNLKNGNFMKYWTPKQTKDLLESLRRNLIDKIQLCVSLATLEVVIDTNDKMDEFLPSMEELLTVSDSAQSRSVTMASIRTILQPMVVGMRREDPKIEEIISLFRGNEANVKTSTDVQKFLADVSATLQTLTDNERDDFLDPITMHLMTDPVKCFDGRTYDRFSVLRYNMTQETPLEIACDDLDVRECLFERFDGVQAQFEYLRTRYRDEALMLANEGHSAEALSMLKNVLQWAPNDEESCEKSTKLEQELAAVAGRKEFKPWQEKGLPTHLDSSKCSPLLTLSTNKLFAQYSGSPEEICTDAGAVQGNCPIPDKGSFYYFELSVINQGHLGRMSIGFADKNFKLSLMPGCEPDSYGYHGDDGKLFHGRLTVGDPFSPTFTTGDTVGAGILYATQEVFFTKNGKLVGTTVKITLAQLYPTIGLGSWNEMMDVNFGQVPFICDVDALISGKLAGEHLPAHFSFSNCSPVLTLSTDKLSANYSGHQLDSEIRAVGAVQGNYPVPYQAPFHYFEISVKNGEELGMIGIGYADQNFKLSRMPGWEPNSYGYHGDDGKLYHGSSTVGDPFGPTFTTGDTVGAGIHNATQELFFTKNGKLVGRTAKDTTFRLYPTIGMQNLNAMVDVNFGQDPFICDVDALLSGILAREDLPTHVNPVRNKGETEYGYIAIGYADEKLGLGALVDGVAHMIPGNEHNSYGYDSSGCLRIGPDEAAGRYCHKEIAGVPRFTTGDTVGAGIYYSTQAVFFTKNGHFVGTTALEGTTLKNSIHNATQEAKNDQQVGATTILNINPRLYPSVGMNSTHAAVDVNFGQYPFKCDVGALISEKLSSPCNLDQDLTGNSVSEVLP